MRCRIVRPGLARRSSLSLVTLAAVGVTGLAPVSAQGPSKPADRPAAEPAVPARFRYGQAPLPAFAPTRTPYIDPADGEPCIAPEMLRALSIDSAADLKQKTVTLTRRDGGAAIVLPGRKGPAGRSGLFVAARDAIRELGGQLQWDADAGVGIIRSVLQEIRLERGAVVVKATLPVTPLVTSDPENGRVLVDFPAALVGDLPRQLELESELVKSARTGQFDENTARLVVDLNRSAQFRWIANTAGTQISLGPDVVAPQPIAVVPTPTAKPVIARRGAPSLLKAFRWIAQSDERAQLAVDASRLPIVRPTGSGNRLVLDFANVAVADRAADSLQGLSHPLVKSVRVASAGATATRLIVELAQAARFALRLNPRGGVLLNLIAAGRRETMPLIGRTIVVDPGHGGGASTGTRGVDGRLEKINTLAMGLDLADALEALGANVILTRDCDADPGLHERALIANRMGADLFVSIHCNDGGINHIANGSIVFYHMQSEVCRQLAESITTRLRTDVAGIRSQRPRSDSAVYKNDGFAVLRMSQMAGVLVETGFMSNYADAAALRKPETQKQVAQAIASGILDFLAANPDLDTRLVKPQPLRDEGLPTLDPAPPTPVQPETEE